MSDYKKRIEEALLRFHEKDHKEIQKLNGVLPKRKKNLKPEKIVETECLKWMREQGWEVQIYESKAIYNPKAGTYTQNQSVKTGNADCQGIMPDGTSVAVEFKALGKLSTFLKDTNLPQRDFILKRIHMNGFACVVDSAEMLKTIYIQWEKLKQKSDEAAKQYLFSMLPQRKKEKQIDTPKNEFGF